MNRAMNRVELAALNGSETAIRTIKALASKTNTKPHSVAIKTEYELFLERSSHLRGLKNER